MRILAVDYGDTRTGIAVSDLTRTLVGEAWTVTEKNAKRLASLIARTAAERGASILVVGYPRNMDGTVGPRAQKAEALGELLRQLCADSGAYDVVFWDERRTTVDAHRILSEAGRHGEKRRAAVDAVAASLILEGYLNSLERPTRA
ncbi:MAG: Holliday junction resolvase RuvX [Oscillospiraceae bacterium]|jgi:putative Holliday junction resolvase|nr:Holliday junction resolvase RuvX [Oscillospiraceae bacterium]